jgi:ParB-like chromosome segregation protein Spo0J
MTRPDLIALIPLRQIEPLTAYDPALVADYVAMLKAGKQAPPIRIRLAPRAARPFSYRLVDGSHRLAAAKIVGRKTILARIQENW